MIRPGNLVDINRGASVNVAVYKVHNMLYLATLIMNKTAKWAGI